MWRRTRCALLVINTLAAAPGDRLAPYDNSQGYASTPSLDLAPVSPNVQSAAQEYYIGDNNEESQHNTGTSAISDLVEQVAELVVKKLVAKNQFKLEVAKHVVDIETYRANNVFSDIGGTADHRR